MKTTAVWKMQQQQQQQQQRRRRRDRPRTRPTTLAASSHLWFRQVKQQQQQRKKNSRKGRATIIVQPALDAAKRWPLCSREKETVGHLAVVSSTTHCKRRGRRRRCCCAVVFARFCRLFVCLFVFFFRYSTSSRVATIQRRPATAFSHSDVFVLYWTQRVEEASGLLIVDFIVKYEWDFSRSRSLLLIVIIGRSA